MREITNAINVYRNNIHNTLEQETDKAAAVALAIGLTVGSMTPLPSESVADPKDWYVTMVLEGVQEKVNTINESFVVDVKTVLRITRDVWEMRYAMVHMPLATSTVGLLLNAVAQGPAELSDLHAKLVANNKYAVENLVAALKGALCPGK